MAVKRFSKYPVFSGDAIRFEAQVEVEAIAPLCRLMDIYEGVAFVRTKDPRQAIVEFWVSPFYIEDFRVIISALKRDIPMVLLEERPACHPPSAVAYGGGRRTCSANGKDAV